MNDVRAHALGFADHLEMPKAFQNFFPSDLELEFSQAIPNAVMGPKTKRSMPPRLRPIDNECFRVINVVGITIAGQIPQRHPVTGVNGDVAQTKIF